MSGIEVIGTIGAVLGIIDETIKVYNSVHKDIKLSETFKLVAIKLPVLEGILKTCEADFQRIGSIPKEDADALLKAARSCDADAQTLREIFKNTLPGDADEWYTRYKKVFKRLGKGNKVEELLLRITEDTKLLATYHGVKSVNPELGSRLDDLLKDLRTLDEPSVPDDADTSYTFSNTGSGRINAVTGSNSILNENTRVYGQGSGNHTFNFGNEVPEHWFTDKIQFHGRYNRERELNTIRCDPKSFEWLKQTNFVDWITSPKEKVFWITGKPASGKSMLMNYISKTDLKVDFKTTHRHLRLHFFFDYKASAETAISNSIEGLQRTILDQLCKAVPGTSLVLENYFDLQGKLRDQWLHDGSTLNEMFNFAFDHVEARKESIFLLLDGLDDYKGDLNDVVSIVRDLEVKASVAKLCVSSRPHEFYYEFNSWPQLTMEKYNEGAIFVHTLAKISPRPGTIISEERQKMLVEVAGEIARRASGVFLWAAFAANEMCTSMRHFEPPHVWQKRLDKLPQSLSKFYMQIIQQLNDNRTACGQVLRLITSYNGGTRGQEICASELLEACHILEVSGFRHKNIVTEESIVEFLHWLGPKTGGLLTFVYLEYPIRLPDRARRTSTDKIDYRRIGNFVIRLLHRSLYDFLNEGDNWSECFPQFDLSQCPTELWLNVCAGHLSQPLEWSDKSQYQIEIYKTSLRRARAKKRVKLAQLSLKTTVMSRFLSLMLDYERMNAKAVPWRIFDSLNEKFLSAHVNGGDHTLYGVGCYECQSVRGLVESSTEDQWALCTIGVAMRHGLVLTSIEYGAQYKFRRKSCRQINEYSNESELIQTAINSRYWRPNTRLELLRCLSVVSKPVLTPKCIEDAIDRLSLSELEVILDHCVWSETLLSGSELADSEFISSTMLGWPHELRKPKARSHEELKLWGKRWCDHSSTIMYSILIEFLRPHYVGRQNGRHRKDNLMGNLVPIIRLCASYGVAFDISGPNCGLADFVRRGRKTQDCCMTPVERQRCDYARTIEFLADPSRYIKVHPHAVYPNVTDPGDRCVLLCEHGQFPSLPTHEQVVDIPDNENALEEILENSGKKMYVDADAEMHEDLPAPHMTGVTTTGSSGWELLIKIFERPHGWYS